MRHFLQANVIEFNNNGHGCQCYKTFLLAVKDLDKKFQVKAFKPSLIFESEARAYPKGAPF
jgi:hypothetical protein